MEEEISLVELFDILKKHIKLIVTSIVLTTAIAAAYTFILATPTYEASTEILVSHSVEEEPGVSEADISSSIKLINTYSDVIRNDVTLEPVIDKMNLDMSVKDLRDEITIVNEEDSQVFSIQVQNENPYDASEIANTLADTFQEEIYDMMNIDNVTIISAAVPNPNAVSPNNLLNLVIGVLLGGMIGVALVFIRELTDNTVKSDDFITEEIGWPTLGQVGVFTKDDLMVKTALPRGPQPAETEEQEMKRRRRRV